VHWSYAISIVLVHLAALLALHPWFFSWTGLVLCLAGFYCFGTLGINLGYHRLLTHRSLVVPQWLERALATLGMCCLQDSPGRWVAIHRIHHQHSDEQPDPHSPLVNFLWGHMGWILFRNRQYDSTSRFERYCRDVLRDRYFLWCERHLHFFLVYIIHAALFFGTALLAGRWMSGNWETAFQFASSILVWGVLLRTVLVWHITWSVNSLAHIFGYQNYETGDYSRNNVFVGFISNGEGWHNNHHAHQRCAAHGHRWWELDVTFATIRLLEFVGLARDVVRYPLDRPSRTQSHDSAELTRV
jgi:fatty-acid desaturase